MPRLCVHDLSRCSSARALLLVAAYLFAGYGLLAPDASAQNPAAAKDRHTIVVEPGADACTYRIQGQTNQDVFVIRPQGRLTVRALRGLWVDVSVEDDVRTIDNEARRVPGMRRQRTLALRQPRGQALRQDTLSVRAAIGQTTEHRVRIECCPRQTRSQGCPEWQAAQPYDASTGDAGRPRFYDPNRTPAFTGPSAAPVRLPAALVAPPSLPLPPGGPVMRIEEL